MINERGSTESNNLRMSGVNKKPVEHVAASIKLNLLFANLSRSLFLAGLSQ